ncbi:MAG: hypothetical protein ACE5F1_17605, partial [Planctomycetota bacterium]
GRFGLGYGQFVLAWVLADLALLLLYVIRDPGAVFVGSLWGLQLLSLLSGGLYAWGRLRRRLRSFRERQDEEYSRALDAFMSGADEQARRGFLRAFRRDPWDHESAAMLGVVLAARPALRWLRKARTLSSDRTWTEEIDEDIKCATEALKHRNKRPMPEPLDRTPRPRRKPSLRGRAGS